MPWLPQALTGPSRTSLAQYTLRILKNHRHNPIHNTHPCAQQLLNALPTVKLNSILREASVDTKRDNQLCCHTCVPSPSLNRLEADNLCHVYSVDQPLFKISRAHTPVRNAQLVRASAGSDDHIAAVVRILFLRLPQKNTAGQP